MHSRLLTYGTAFRLLLSLLFTSLIASFCLPLTQSPPDKESRGERQPSMADLSDSYLLGPGDQVTVHCMNAEEFGNDGLRVDGDGNITLPFLGRVKVGGFSVREVQQQITDNLAKYIVNPVVSVNLINAQSQPVTVIGALKAPGVIQLQGKKTLLEILSSAGGLREDAGPTIRLTRRATNPRIGLPGTQTDPSAAFSFVDIDVKDLIQSKDPQVNIQVLANDVISVSTSGIVYVVGEVRRPGGFPLREKESISVLQALSLAEGLQHTAATSKARIVRAGSNATRVDIAINVSEVLSGRKSDIALRADDILYIPNNAAKSAGIKALDSAIQLATGIVVYGRY